MNYDVLLDTSFFIRLLNEKDSLHQNTVEYYLYFLENKINLYISTISIAEFCVFSKIENLPLKNLNIIEFKLNHAIKAAEFAKVIYNLKKANLISIEPRVIIPNDTKLFSQCDVETNIKYFVTSDKRSKIIYKHLEESNNIYRPNFLILDINQKITNQEFII